MTRVSIEADSFRHQNPIPNASRIGPLIESSIISPFDVGSRDIPTSLDGQIENLFVHMASILDAAEATWDDVVKVTFFVVDAAASRQALNGPWLERFPDEASRPARHNLQVQSTGSAQISCVFTAYVER